MTAHLFTEWFPEYFKPMFRPTAQKKKILSKILLLSDNAPGHPRALMEMYMRFLFFFHACSHNIHSAARVSRSNFNLQVLLRCTFCKVIAAVGSDSAKGCGPGKLKTFWKGFSILDSIRNTHDSWKTSKY